MLDKFFRSFGRLMAVISFDPTLQYTSSYALNEVLTLNAPILNVVLFSLLRFLRPHGS